MSNWQEWAVAFLLLLCCIRIGMSFYSFFRRSEKNENPCAGCATGCDLKRLLDEKRGECEVECEVEREKKKKSCCG